MAIRELRVFWATATHRCVLYRVDGTLELWLRTGDRVTALATCRDLTDAGTLAQQWLDRLHTF